MPSDRSFAMASSILVFFLTSLMTALAIAGNASVIQIIACMEIWAVQPASEIKEASEGLQKKQVYLVWT